jgi:putative restriction endonuclease
LTFERHSSFTSGSPSVQIDIRTLEDSLQDGMAFDRKNNKEIAIGFRPDQFMSYAHNAPLLHKFGRQVETYELLRKASQVQDIPESEMAPLAPERKRIVQEISKLSRQANFRQQVLRAYGYRCAISKMQLRLVDAAHILPVGAPGSLDHVKNGIALAPTYHRAFDNGLIFLDEKYTVHINSEKESALIELNLDGGLSGFKSSLGRVLLPPDRQQWPGVNFIREANDYRRRSQLTAN